MALTDLFPWTPRTGDPDPRENFSTLGKWLGILRKSISEINNSVSKRLSRIETRMTFDAKARAKIYYTSQWPTFAQLLTAIGSNAAIVHVNSTVTLTADTTVPSNVSIRDGGGLFVLGNYDMTINGPFDWGLRQAFSYTGTGVVTFGGPGETEVIWFYDSGGDYAGAFNAAMVCHGDDGNEIKNPPTTSLPIGSTITISNSHIKWESYGNSFNDDTVQRIIWTGSAGGTMVSSTAGIVGCDIDIVLDGAHITKWGFVGDLIRRSDIRLTVMRSVGFWYFTNCYYTSFRRMNARLQTPGTYIGGTGQVSLADWIAVNNSGFAAPCTWRSNANVMRIENLSLSKVGAYEIPATATAISQMVLLSGQNIEVDLSAFESLDADTIPSGAEDGTKFGFNTGISGTGSGQLTNAVLSGLSSSNTNSHLIYVALTNSGSTRTINVYKSQAAATANVGGADLIGTGSRDGDGIAIIHEQNASGFHGQWTVTYTTNTTSIVYRANYSDTISRITRIESGTAISLRQIYIEQAFVSRILEVASGMRGGMAIGMIYAEDCHFSSSLISSSSLKDLRVGPITGIGVTCAGPYISDNSTSTQINLDSLEFHNRYVVSGGVNYSEEMRGLLGVVATSGYLPVIYQPYVVSGLVASASSDSISDYIQITPGSIRDGLGRPIVCGRYESVNSLTALAGWRFRPGPVAASWNVCVDAAGCVFIENQASLKASDEQGKIILATYTTNGSGVVSGFSAVSSPKCLRGIVPSNGGGLSIPGTLSRDADDIFTVTDHSFRANSADGSDNRRVNFTGGGAASITRGGVIQIAGNEHAQLGAISLAIGNVTGSKLRLVAQGTEHHYMDNDGYWVNGNRVQLKKASDIASANDITLGLGNCYTITGSTQINRILTTGWQSGAMVSLILPASIVLSHNTASGSGYAGFWLVGLANWTVGANGGMIQLTYDGTYWRESAARVNY